jgi:hypothetical protein
MESADTLDPADAAQAVKLGLFVNVAYQMWSDHPGVAAPPPPSDLPAGYSFAAWVQMRDFLFASGELVFYGLIARSPDGADSILAIRGTATPEEWVDDLTSLVPAPWTGPGQVGYGFNRIYQTLRVVPFDASAVAAAPLPRPSEPASPFAEQVANAVRQAARPPHRRGEMAAPQPETSANAIRVVAHSLGSALATLYVAENVKVGRLDVELICTFASPKVGDHQFAASFDALNGANSWRIVNELDIVPYLPPIGFEHVDKLQAYNSGLVVNPLSPGCCHSLDTYLHLLDPNQPLPAGCQLLRGALASQRAPGRVVAAAAPQRETAASAPAGKGATITVTVRVEPS